MKKQEDTKTPSKKTPAQKAIEAFGGIRALGRVLDIDHVWIWRWTKPRGKNVRLGSIPVFQQQRILDAAKKLGVRLSKKDLVDFD
jgi:hypothetical protein